VPTPARVSLKTLVIKLARCSLIVFHPEHLAKVTYGLNYESLPLDDLWNSSALRAMVGETVHGGDQWVLKSRDGFHLPEAVKARSAKMMIEAPFSGGSSGLRTVSVMESFAPFVISRSVAILSTPNMSRDRPRALSLA
jgi:hypothetical protein